MSVVFKLHFLENYHGQKNRIFSLLLLSCPWKEYCIVCESSPNAGIGHYNLSIQSVSSSPTSLDTFILLFNPWSSGDDVFMPNKAEREEYVLEEFGIIFAGNKNHISSFEWNFGQSYTSEEQESGVEIRTCAKPCYTD
ncbi:protein-glutamine gamma-glutamyltransferase e-like [Limosa lapponica baueri]|uniref:Protein-glutamine gamma-glutamyltransferase e-like n=1 Tax=Limosa lapponica baueri TaxID=1758121 RepID=A0A2I0TWH3_LIMLA|nr:protein-glutamine gamma-glutamyltransferase e-like [Limosa lapponica baueri]